MATYQIPAPPPMSIKGDVVENWRDFETSWDYYTIATDLRSKETTDAGKEIVAATLCTVMGPESKKIMNSLPSLTDADKKNQKRIIEELRKYFVPQRNVLYERFVFNSATQKPSETVDEYVVRLRQLANSCEFGDLKDSLIRDRIVIGTSDENGRERLLRERPVPNLDKVVESLRAAEISRTHKQVINGKQDAGQVETIHYTDKRNKRTNQKKGKGSQSSGQPKPQKQTQDRRPAHKSQNPSQSCHWCGKKADHNKKGCPAKDVQCHNCGKTGHFAVVCRSNKQVHEVNEEDVSYPEDYYLDDCYFMGELNDTNDDFWSAEVLIDNRPCTLKLDSGSKVTVIGENTPWLRAKRLDKVTSVFRGPGGVNLSHLIKGQITNALFAVGGNTHRENVYVIKNQSKNLLSKSAIQALHLLIPSAAVHNVETAPNFKAEFPELFKGLGLMKEKYKIPLKSDAVSVCLYTPRRVPHPLLPKVKEKLLSMVNQKVISPVNDPTDWCSGMVIAPKRNGDVRICVDLTPLNKAVKREVHPMASVDENLAKLKDSKVFTKLDANSGFWQIPLDEESRLLTTFVTPFGRYCFNRLPFGISSAPEIFQRAMSRILEGLDGTVCHMDDILIHGETQELHDSRVRKVLQRLKDAGVTLNDKCEFSKQRMKFLGHVISENGVEADPEKTKAIREFPRPTTVTELQRFNGMVNQLAKFLPNLATINEPLRQLLKKGQQWLWDQPQERAFQAIKDKLTSTDVLAHYDPNKQSIIAADACQDGLGAVLLQVDGSGNRRPIAFASRSLNDTEKRYAVIEKEALAATWACEKFSDYVLGTPFTQETDHRPLVPLLSNTDLSKLPPRVLRFRLRMARYAPEVTYVQGVHQNTADALSRAPTTGPTPQDLKLIEEVEEHSESTLESLPATEQRLKDIKEAQDCDAICKQVKTYCLGGWPPIMPSLPLLKPYWEKKQHLTVTQGLLMYDHRIVIPSSMQLEMLEAIHEGHLGITKCQGRASYSVWWPLITKQIKAMVNRCHTCAKLRPERREPLMALSFPSLPWSRIGTDLFELDQTDYLIVVDYASRWFEIRKLRSTTSAAVTRHMCEIFALHGIPDTVVSDNGPQYISQEFADFAKDMGFTHITSSPLYPQANGEVERAVQTAKNILRKNANPHLGLLAYRSAPLANGLTPSEILMGRRLRNKLPLVPENLRPRKIDQKKLQKKEQEYRERYSDNYNTRHRAVELPTLQQGDKVFIRDQARYGEVEKKLESPRSYQLVTETGSVIRRNRRALVHKPEVQSEESSVVPSPPDQPPAHEGREGSPGLAASPSPTLSEVAVRKSGRLTKAPNNPDMIYY